MRNFTKSELSRTADKGFFGFHSSNPNMASIVNQVVHHYVPKQTGKIFGNEMVTMQFNISECKREERAEVETMMVNMIHCVAKNYATVSEIENRVSVVEHKSVYTGNNTVKVTLTITTPVLSSGKKVIIDAIDRACGNIPESGYSNWKPYKVLYAV